MRAKEISESGLLLSEHPFPAQPTQGDVFLRNRIISDLSIATIFVETKGTTDIGIRGACSRSGTSDFHMRMTKATPAE